MSDPDAVWSTVIKLVPSESAQLLAAKPRVEIVDLGERYRVRVATDRGTLERMYADPARDCEKRVRFAAEFIVVSLLPPQLGVEPDTTSTPARTDGGAAATAGSSQGAPPPAESALPAPAPAPASTATVPPTPPVAPPVAAARQTRSSFVRVELSAISEVSPPLGAPTVLAWGGALRARVGPGALAGIVGIAYLPKANFNIGDFTGAATRVPATLGMRVQVTKKRWQLDGDVALSAALERYEGVSPRAPSEATR